MRSLTLIASLMLATSAMADKTVPSAAKELDKSSPAAADAQDYNSSRSNNSSSVHLHAEGVVHRDVASREKGSGMATGRRQHSPVTTCSNDIDNDCDDVADESATRAQDYNSSRSNTTSARLDDDSDGDSILEEVRCSKTSDDCVGIVDNGDPVVRKKPGKR